MAKQKVKVGSQAPLFALNSYNAGKIDLKQEFEQQKIVLIFSRYFGCPICLYELDLILKNSEALQKNGTKILYITQSGDSIANQYITEKKIPFPVIFSSKDELYKTYGLKMFTLGALTQVPSLLSKAKAQGFTHGEYEGWENQCPGQLVISTTGKILFYHKGWLELEKLLSQI